METFMAVAGVFFIIFLISVPFAWILMLLAGMVHSGWAAFPALGFWPTWALMMLINFTFGRLQVQK